MTGIGDVLSGSSLIVAILAAFYSLWQPAIAEAKNADVPRDAGNRRPVRDRVRSARLKVLPLLAIASATWVILLPRTLNIINGASECASGAAATSVCHYYDSGALFILTEVLLLALSVVFGYESWQLRAKAHEIGKS